VGLPQDLDDAGLANVVNRKLTLVLWFDGSVGAVLWTGCGHALGCSASSTSALPGQLSSSYASLSESGFHGRALIPSVKRRTRNKSRNAKLDQHRRVIAISFHSPFWHN